MDAKTIDTQRINAHLNYFQINACGLYKTGLEESLDLNLSETFQHIYEWVGGRDFKETIPWNAEQSREGKSKCYCHDIYKCEITGDFLLVLWKSDSSNNGSILGAQANAKTGESEVVEYSGTQDGVDRIWGRPCYYWVIPEIQTIVSIKFEHSLCDTDLFQDWVKACINNRANIPNKTKEVTPTGIIRFEFKNSSDVNIRTSFRFEVKLKMLETATTELTTIASKITHIVCRDTIILNAPKDDRSPWVRFFDRYMPKASPKTNSTTRQIEIKAEARPSVTELKAIIDKFSVDNRSTTNDWNNVGFVTNYGPTIWVDRFRLHKKTSINFDGYTVIPASVIHSSLNNIRQYLLKEIFLDNEKSAKAPALSEEVVQIDKDLVVANNE